jgi:predicted lactoylglutathione lyase
MTTINAVTLDVADPAAAEAFYQALGVGHAVSVRAGEAGAGFRGYTLSLVVAQPGDADAFLSAATAAGATVVKPAKKSFWGYGGVVQAPDGALWKVACSAKKDTAPVSQSYQDLVLLLGVDDVKATKQFYADNGLTVGKAYGSKYVEFDGAGSTVKLALYGRKALAKDAGVAPEGTGPHGITVRSDGPAFTDPDGFAWTGA